MKKVFILNLVVAFSLLATVCSAQWVAKTAPTSSVLSSYDLWVTDWADENVVFAAGGNGGTGQGGIILKSMDAGENWSIVYESQFGPSIGVGIEAYNADTIIAAGRMRDTNMIMRSFDGGATWNDITQNLDSANQTPGGLAKWYGYFFKTDMSPGGHIAITCGNSGAVIVSTDFGNTWDQRITGVARGSATALHFKEDTALYLASTSERFLKYLNPGTPALTRVFDNKTNNGARSLFVTNNGNQVILGKQDGIRVNYDGFSSTNSLNALSSDRIDDFAEVFPGQIISSVRGGMTAYISEDTGRNWTAMQSSNNNSTYAVDFHDPNRGILVGENNTILKYSGFSIKTANLANPFCSGGTFDLIYEMTSDFVIGSGNSFTLVMSDINGNFVTMDTVRITSFSNSNLKDTIKNITLPAGVMAGTYKLRLEGSSLSPSAYSIPIDLKVGLDQPMVSIFAANASGNIAYVCNPSDSVTLFAPSGYSNYTWSNGKSGASLNQIKIGMGDTVNLIVDSLGCSSVASNSVMAVMAPAITATVSSTATSSCGASDGSATVTYTGNSSTITYSWGSNAANQTGSTATNLSAGNYSVTLNNTTTGCSKSFPVTVTDGGATPVNFSSSIPTTFCSTDASITLSADQAASFSGSGVSGSTFDPSTAGVGTHELIATFVSGACTTYDTLKVVVSTKPSVPSITKKGTDSLDANVMASKYVWYRDNTMLPDSTKVIFYSTNGAYKVVAMNGDCASDTSQVFSTTSISDLIDLEVEMYPVPASNVLNVEIPIEISSVQIYAVDGSLVYNENFVESKSTLRLNLEPLSKGFYFLSLQAKEGRISKRFIKE